MNETALGVEQTEPAILTFEVSDEALEAAAVAEKDTANLTLWDCTTLFFCPIY
jgi:hypothetical protein